MTKCPPRLRSLFVAIFCSFVYSTAHNASAQIIDGSPAVGVLGHYAGIVDGKLIPKFDKSGGAPHDGPSFAGFESPTVTLVDSTNHRLYVGDRYNYRVLVFNLTSSNELIDLNADYVLGASDLGAYNDVQYEASLEEAAGFAFDPDRNWLFMSDSALHRVLVFDVSEIENGELPIHVLGQPDFTSSDTGTTASSVNRPRGLEYDAAGKRLFVADNSNNRVLVFDVTGVTNGEAAVAVLGQPDMTSSGSNLTQNGLEQPTGLAYDAAGQRLFVSQPGFHRVSVFNVASISNGQNAIHVLGQPDFETAGSAHSAVGFDRPRGLAYKASTNQLFVVEEFGNRVKVFDVDSITNGESAVFVLGQTTFTGSNSGTSVSTFSAPSFVSYDPTSDHLFVGDTDNNRVMIFSVASLSNGQNAIDLVGQDDQTSLVNPVPDFSRSGTNNAPNRRGYSTTQGVALDAVHHRLFVADRDNHRVLVYNLSAENKLMDLEADFVLGQSGFAGNSPGVTASTFDGPNGLAYDPVAERLFVVDQYNNRVLVFSTASLSNGESAVNVLGQGDFVSNGGGVSATSLNGPSGLIFDATGQRLFVVDSGANRVLVFSVASITDGEAAVNVLGQANFSSSSASTTQSTLTLPNGGCFDAVGERLFIADQFNNRVVVYDASSISDGNPATAVLGRPNFTTAGSGRSQSLMDNPQDCAYDPTTKFLYVTDRNNSRVMVFDVNSISNGEAAAHVLGKPDFTASNNTMSRTNLSAPTNIAIDVNGGRLYVSESLGGNRVVVFATKPMLASHGIGFRETSSDNGTVGGSLTVAVANDTFSRTSGAFTAGVDYTFSNVPSGLTGVVIATSATTAAVTFVGQAVAHDNGNDVSNVTLTFLSPAFTGGDASSVADNFISGILIDFIGDAPTPTPTATPTITPSPSATATAAPTSSPTPEATPTAVPTVVPTLTPTPVATVSPQPTSRPGVTPTPDPRLLGSIDVEKRGLRVRVRFADITGRRNYFVVLQPVGERGKRKIRVRRKGGQLWSEVVVRDLRPGLWRVFVRVERKSGKDTNSRTVVVRVPR